MRLRVCIDTSVIGGCLDEIVRLDKIKAYNEVNRALGYGVLTIISPKEVGYGRQDQE